MSTVPPTAVRILNAIRGGAHDVYAIAEALDVKHTNYTLRRELHDLTKAGVLTRTPRSANDGRGPYVGQAGYLFDIRADIGT